MKVLEFKGKMSLKNKILIALSILIVLIIIGVILAYIINEDARDWLNVNILRKEITEEDLASIKLESDKSQYIFAYDKYITILCNGKLDIYNSYASKVSELEIGISNPIFIASGSYLAIADRDAQKLCLISEGKIQWENKIEGNIKKINVNRRGDIAVVTEGTSYKSVIITFDKNGKELFKTYLASTIAIEADLSVNGKYLAIAEVDIGGALIQSSIKIIEVEKASKGDTTNSIIYKYNAPSNKIITDIKYQERGQLVCRYDDSIHIIDEEIENTLLEFNPNVQINDINLKNYIIRAEEISTGLFSSKTDVILTNILTNTENTYSIHAVIKKLVSYEQMTAINLGTELHLITLNGWLEKKYTSKQEIKDVVLGSSVAGVIYRDRIKIITF